jgi:hypothetical protein
MKSFLKYCLILITSICYMTAALELCEAEKKQNYEKETHTYIHEKNQAESYHLKIVKQLNEHFLLKDYWNTNFILYSSVHNTLSFYTRIRPPKPDKLYLHYSVLLI